MSETGEVGFQGYKPVIKVEQGNPEAEKYGKMWEQDEYRAVAPGEDLVSLFLAQVNPRPGSEIIDFGCGTGRGGAALLERGKMRVTLVDFVNNCLDQKVRDLIAARPSEIRFVKSDLEKPLGLAAEYGYCTDVMEHIPEARVHRVLKTVLESAQHVFFSISTQKDHCGAMIGEELHLTVQKYGWWLKQFNMFDCVIHWSMDLGAAAIFYVTSWPSAAEVMEVGSINVSEEQIKANVAANCAGTKWQQVTPYPTNDVEVMIVGGGPSLAEYEGEIKQKRAEGVKLVTLNGAYNWCLDHGLTPSATIVTDARPFNARFVRPVVKDCKYMICSQVDPSVLEGLPDEQTLLWHSSAESIKDVVMKDYPVYWPVPGGSTALLRGIPLLRMLGFKRFHLYGCDSCMMVAPGWVAVTATAQAAVAGQHHAYPQPENDARGYPVTVRAPAVAGRTFWCQAWMVSQAQEFIGLIQGIGDEIELEVHGDGLLAYILEIGAKVADLQAEEQSVPQEKNSVV